MEKEKEEKQKQEKQEVEEEKSKRRTVTPGEVVAVGAEFLPGEGTKREGKEIITTKFGLLEQEDKLLRVIPLSGVYIPRVGNTVIGQISDVTFNGWFVNVIAPHLAFLSLAECSRFVKKDLTEYYNFGDMIVSKVVAVKRKSIDLTMKGAGLYKITGGMIIRINPSRVPRIIGRKGSMVNTIKKETDCSIVVGQNGVIWIKGPSSEKELLAMEAINFVAEKSFLDGLTEKVKEFLEKKKKEK